MLNRLLSVATPLSEVSLNTKNVARSGDGRGRRGGGGEGGRECPHSIPFFFASQTNAETKREKNLHHEKHISYFVLLPLPRVTKRLLRDIRPLPPIQEVGSRTDDTMTRSARLIFVNRGHVQRLFATGEGTLFTPALLADEPACGGFYGSNPSIPDACYHIAGGIYACYVQNEHLLRAPSSVGGHNSTQVDEGGKCSIFLAIKRKAHAP